MAHSRAAEAAREAVEEEVDHGGRVERQNLAQDEAADDRDAEGAPQFRSGTGSERQRQAAEERRHGGHHDGPEAQEACLVDRLFGRLALLAFGLEGKVDHHNRVLFDDADQEDDADQRDYVEIVPCDQQGQDGTHTRRRERGEDRDGVDVAFVQDAEDDVDGDQRGEDQHGLIRQRILERLRRSLEGGLDAGREADLLFGIVDQLDGLAQRDTGRQVE
jgi:hypothetical protein